MSGGTKNPGFDQRADLLAAARKKKMARSAHAFVRGNTAGFYAHLAALPKAKQPPVGPAIWICGDCHVGNLGPIANADGKVEIQIRDLDQTVIGNPAHDLIRLALSLASAARGSDLPGIVTARIVEQMVVGYGRALIDPAEDDPGPEPDVVRVVKRRSLGRKWRHLARERIGDAEPAIPLGSRFWALSEDERHALEALFDDTALQHLVLSVDPRDARSKVRLIDAAYWKKGCSSLGLARYAALFAMRDGNGDTSFGLVDIKEAVASVAPVAHGAKMPADHAERVLAGTKALSPFLGDRMAAARLLDIPVFIRELAPQDLKLELAQFSRAEAVKAAHYLAYVVGRAHARQMDAKQRAEWLGTLSRAAPGLDAPTWLWESVVALAGGHEVDYLAHCREYALTA